MGGTAASPPGLQSLLARVLSTPGLAAELRSAPDDFAARHGYAPGDVRKLAALSPDRMALAAALTTGKRRQIMENTYPGSHALLRVVDGGHALAARVLPTGRFRSAADRVLLGRRLTGLAATLPDTVAVRMLREMIRFETLWYEVGRAAEDARASAPPPVLPALPAGAALAAFGFPVAAVQRVLAQGAPPPAEPSSLAPWQPAYYLVRPAGADRVRVHRLTPGVHALLTTCDGATPLPELAGLHGLAPDEMRRTLDAMTDKGLLRARG